FLLTSRRRHTRSKRDWRSDVCSSDLSMGGVPSPGRPGSGMSLTGTHAGHRSGITIFTPEEAEHADPSAQTNISSGVPDQINLEGVGSGSGLLDLTRESDDTSLGAELLDEIGPDRK